MIQHDRLLKIKGFLSEKKTATTNTLAEYVGVSVVTIRKDLAAMENAGVVTRTHGGVYLNDAEKHSVRDKASPSQLPVQIPAGIDALTDIARDYVSPDDFIFIGSGRTCLSFADKIKDIKGISVITNNISALSILKPYVENIIILGGEIIMTPEGLFATSDANLRIATNGMFVSKAFSSGVGIDAEAGLTVNNMLSTYVTSVIPQLTDKWYLMMDSSKFGIRAFYQAASLDKISTLITDLSDDTMLKKYRDKGVELLTPSTSIVKNE